MICPKFLKQFGQFCGFVQHLLIAVCFLQFDVMSMDLHSINQPSVAALSLWPSFSQQTTLPYHHLTNDTHTLSSYNAEPLIASFLIFSSLLYASVLDVICCPLRNAASCCCVTRPILGVGTTVLFAIRRWPVPVGWLLIWSSKSVFLGSVKSVCGVLSKTLQDKAESLHCLSTHLFLTEPLLGDGQSLYRRCDPNKRREVWMICWIYLCSFRFVSNRWLSRLTDGPVNRMHFIIYF